MHKMLFRSYSIEEVRKVALEGVDYLVAPVIAVAAGVLNGELLLATELEKSLPAWNDVPVPVGHPRENDIPVSARKRSIVNAESIGRLYEVFVEAGKLKGELWIDVAKAQRLGGECVVVLEMLRRGMPVEVSTGYYADISNECGTHDGESYIGIQYNLRPDHLALLPGGKGACDWKDGCGTPRINKELSADMADEKEGRASKALAYIKHLLGVYDMQKDRKKLEKILQELEVPKNLLSGDDESLQWLIDNLGGKGKTPSKPAEGEEKAPPAIGEGGKPAVNEKAGAEAKKDVKTDASPCDKVKEMLGGLDLSVLVKHVKETIATEEAEKLSLLKAMEVSPCTISARTLATLDVKALRELAGVFNPGDYSGAGIPRNKDEGNALLPPPVVLAKRKEE